uniref:Histidinol dehydrogenase n=1 Tax=Eiseniibacteriota bacterium TaxID=2212470 RepID=A0A832I2J0_UNCEI
MSAPWLRFRGALAALPPADRRRLLERPVLDDPAVTGAVAAILERVRREGDAALRALSREHDGVEPAALEVPRAALEAARARLEPAVRDALERAARNVAAAARAALPRPVSLETEPGVTVGFRPDPLPRAGVYAPGGRAAYPSSVLMGVVPARVAGVGEVVVCSPPGRDGLPSGVVLAAAAIAGADRVFAAGGAGAIGALAFGTASVPRVDVVVGPGNAWVAAAKRAVAAEGRVRIDSPAGPSEVLVVADATAAPRRVALELVAQAEHDPRAAVVAVAVGEPAARAIEAALAAAAADAARGEVVRASLAAAGGVLWASGLDEALAFASEAAPEHLLLAVADPEAAFARVRGAGATFLGLSSSVAFGDYLAGGNHVLPTGAFARLASGLSVNDFLRVSQWTRVTPAGARRLAGAVAALAAAEGLPGHAAAALAAAEEAR